MKAFRFIDILCILLIAASFYSCKDDDEKQTESGITGQSWQDGKPLEITAGEELSVNFNANGAWTATSSTAWCKLSNKSGKAGSNALKISVGTDAVEKRTAVITFSVKGYETSSYIPKLEITQQKTTTSITEDMEVNIKVDSYLKEMYLWNDEYKTLDLDYTKRYDSFFKGALKSLTTNTLDKRNSDGEISLFSYIEKRSAISSTRTTKLVDKEQAYSFGITGITPVSIGTETSYTNYFCIQGIYPGSPAEAAGIKRGSMISRINGSEINNGNYKYLYSRLVYPDAAFSLNLAEGIVKEGNVVEKKITSKAMYCNPVIHSQVEKLGGHNIGYLVYSGFEAGFDQELFDVFKEFKSKNITDLVLDLRYNGGGYTISANLIATCIAGAASQGKVFTSLRYNKERMEKRNNKREDELFAYTNYENLKSSLSAGALGLNRVYCLVGNGTASASELVINSLRGIDVEVILIGEKTTGKNVGMEVKDLTVRDNTYRVVPITFQSYNAKGEGDYEKGFEPTADLMMDETNPYKEPNVFLVHKEYGTEEEPLYAKAVQLITGISSITRGMQPTMKGNVRRIPAVFRPGHDGMLKIQKNETSE